MKVITTNIVAAIALLGMSLNANMATKVTNEAMNQLENEHLFNGLSQNEISDVESVVYENALILESAINYGIFDDIKKGFEKAGDAIKHTAESVVNEAKNIGEHAVHVVEKYGKETFNMTKSMAEQYGPKVWEAVKKYGPKALDAIKKHGPEVLDDMEKLAPLVAAM